MSQSIYVSLTVRTFCSFTYYLNQGIGAATNKFIFCSYRQPSLSVTNDELISRNVRPRLTISISLLDGIVISSSGGNFFVTQKVHVLYDSFFLFEIKRGKKMI